MRIAVALSGGVDSAVAAGLLVREGHEVVGVTLQQWPRDDAAELERHGGCCSLDAVEDARRVAAVLDVPYFCWNLEREFGERVIEPFHRAYLDGQTPNPCVRCNRFVRFDLMLGRVLELGFDALATGHYARIREGAAGPELHAAADPLKDQSYMLYHLDRARLRSLRFPLGDLHKSSVREVAAGMGLPVARKPESQEICFVPRGQTRAYLEARLRLRPGPIVDPEGRQVGVHRGAAAFTVGQRSGLGSLAEPGPWFVTRVEAPANRLHVGRAEDLEVRELRLEDVTFVNGSEPEPLACQARLRYHGAAVPGVYEGGRLRLAAPFRAAAPGQAAVLYDGTRVLGGGTIAA